MKVMRRLLKFLIWLCLLPLVLAGVVSVLLYIPPVQDMAVRIASSYVGEATGMKIGIERIRLKFPIDLSVEGVEILSANTPNDTILLLDELRVSIRPRPLLDKEVLIDGVDLSGVRVDTGELIEGITVKGALGQLHLHADRISLDNERAVFNEIRLKDTAITVLLRSASEDTTESEPSRWSLILQKISLENVALACQMPEDSLRIATYIKNSWLSDGEINLGKELYHAVEFGIEGSELWYDANYAAPVDGLDVEHLALSDIDLKMSALMYAGKDIGVTLENFSFRERSGLEMNSLVGLFQSDEERIDLAVPILQTKNSKAKFEADIPWSVIEEKSSGEMRASLKASLGKDDILLAAGALPREVGDALPRQAVDVEAQVGGNLARLRLDRMEMRWPGILDVKGRGEIVEMLDSTKQSGEMEVEMRSQDLNFLLDMLPASKRAKYAIPQNMKLRAKAEFDPEEYRARLHFHENDGTIVARAQYRPKNEAYSLAIKVDSLEPVHFMPADSLLWLAAILRAEGAGSDFFAKETWVKADGMIYDIRYGNQSVSDVRLGASLREHIARVRMQSEYPLAKADVSLDAVVKKDWIDAKLVADMEHIDLQGLHLHESPLSTSFRLVAEASTDLDKRYDADVTFGEWKISTAKQTARPKTLELKAHSDRDTTSVAFHAGDLSLTLAADSGIMALADQFTKVAEDANRQMREDSVLLLRKLRPLLPNLRLTMAAKEDNPLYNFLALYGMEFERVGLEARTSPEEGIHIDGGVFRLARDTFRIDTIALCVKQDSIGISYRADVKKHTYMKQPPFTLSVDGTLQQDYADALLRYADGRDSTGVLLGMRIGKVGDAIGLHLFPNTPVLAFNRFTLNPDNYILYKNEKDIRANIMLKGQRDASFRVHSHVEDGSMQQIHAEIAQIDLGEIARAFPEYLPGVSGILNGDFQYIPSDSSYLVASGMVIDSLHYNGNRVGDMLLNLIYLPAGQNMHQVDMHLMCDQQEIVSATASYRPGEEDKEVEDYVEGTLAVTSLPLPMLNAFIPDGMAQLSGNLQGEMEVKGSSASPDIEGYLQMDSAKMYIGMVNSTLSFDPKRITVGGQRIYFDKYSIYSAGENPFVIDGSIDFRNMDMAADLTLSANNMQLLDAKRTRESLVYGKIFVDMNTTVKGPLSSLSMRGNLRLLGGTNVTYVMQDSPLMVQDRLSGLVSFVSFAEDSVRRRRPLRESLPLGGMDMLLTIGIDQAVQANVDLTPDKSSHVNLEGGGDLSFQYTPLGEMVLSGRYTLSGGTVRYSLPVIPLKDFSIQEGSYVQWSGDVMDPTLNLRATERIRTSVTSGENSTRMVNFDVGIALTQRLENLGLQFILEAPEDAAMQEELARMGEEEKAKQAVSMLVTGMYLAGGSSGTKTNLNMGDALNSFLQSEINNIAGSALKTIDINFGMESYDEDGNGSKRTDYSFRFAKRFYNDRIRVVLGGRISTGADINQGQAQPFIDDVSIEYRLDASGTRYVKLFHNKDYESLLEGELTETGAGIVLRKKMKRMRELFIFRRNKPKEEKMAEPASSESN